jgi:hypothetical protein
MMRIQLFLAVLVAAIGRLIREAADLRFALSVRTTVSPDMRHARLWYCRNKCPIYFRPLGTCGSPLRRLWARIWGIDNPYVRGGCDCHMPTKARIEANCWAFDQGIHGVGWPVGLNSFPPDAKA